MSVTSERNRPGEVPMSYEEYLRLDTELPVEYVDGAAVMSPMPSLEHARIIARLQRTLDAALPGDWECLSAAPWKPGADEFGPDLAVLPVDAPGQRFTGVPPLVCEVVSTNRSYALVRKVQKYAQAGAVQYWIVDPRDREIVALALRDGIYEEYARLDAEHRAADLVIPVGDGVTVHLELSAVLGS